MAVSVTDYETLRKLISAGYVTFPINRKSTLNHEDEVHRPKDEIRPFLLVYFPDSKPFFVLHQSHSTSSSQN